MIETEIQLERESVDSTVDDRMKQELEDYDKLKPFIKICFNLSHDINNPLAGILGNAEYLLTDKAALTDEQRTGLKQIIECAERIMVKMGQIGELKATLDHDHDAAAVFADRLSPIC